MRSILREPERIQNDDSQNFPNIRLSINMLHNFQVVSFLATIIITQSGFVYSISFDPYNTTL